MSVIVRFKGRLGNNLFQYAIGRIIAEELGYSLDCQEDGGPTITGSQRFPVDSTFPGLTHYFPNADLRIHGSKYEVPVESYELSTAQRWSGQIIDLASIVSNRSPRQIRLEGYFQRYEYFKQYSTRVRNWFFFQKLPTSLVIDGNDVLLTIRRGMDFGLNKWVLPLSYYEQVLDNLSNIGKVYICGTDIDESVLSRLRAFRPIYFFGNSMEQFSFTTRFSRIVMSNSTFTWWAAFLSDADEIYAPHSPNGSCYAFTGFEDISLDTGEDRYKKVVVKECVKVDFALQNLSSLDHVRREKDLIVVTSVREQLHTALVEYKYLSLIEWLVQQQTPFKYTAISAELTLEEEFLLSYLVKSHILRVVPVYGEV